MAVNQLIIPTTATATSMPFSPNGKNNVGLCCNALLTTETITLQVYDSANAIWANALSNGTTFQITATTNFMSIYADTNTYRLVKSVTANSVGINCNSDIQFNYLVQE